MLGFGVWDLGVRVRVWVRVGWGRGWGVGRCGWASGNVNRDWGMGVGGLGEV